MSDLHLGAGIIALPFVALFIYGVTEVSVARTVLAFAFVAFAVSSALVGAHFLTRDPR